MRHESTTRRRTGLHGNRAHMTIISIVTIRMMQTNVDAEVDLVILWIPPTRVDDLVRIRRGVNGTIRNAIIHTIVTIVVNPIAETVRPITSRSRVANAGLRWRGTGGRGGWTSLARLITRVGKNDIVVGVIGRGVIEDRLL